MTLRGWIAAAAIVSGCALGQAAHAAWQLEKPINIYIGSDADHRIVVADMNHDGLLDIIATQGTYSNFTENKCWVSVTLQTTNGFSFPYVFEEQGRCRYEFMTVADVTKDPGPEILVSPVINETPAAMRLIEFREDRSLVLLQSWGKSGWFGVVDIDQDRRDDVFSLHEEFQEGTPDEIDLRYHVGFAVTPLRTGDGKLKTGWFRPYVSKYFSLSGVTRYSDPLTSTVERLDLDGDGYQELFAAKCPTACLFRQEPWGQLRTMAVSGLQSEPIDTTFADIDGDGMPDALWVGRDNNGFNVSIALQTAPKKFQSAGAISPLLRTSRPAAADLDLNGLTDIVFGTENGPNTGRLYAFMQQEPGVFEAVSVVVLGWPLSQPRIGDFNNDGCPDILTSNENNGVMRLLRLYRGKGCAVADLAVTNDVRNNEVVVRVTHARGTKPLPMRTMRVVIAPAMQYDGKLGLKVTPPGECVPRASDAPRRTFDCLFDMTAGTWREFIFRIALAQDTEVRLHANAFLLDEAGEGRANNNRSRVDAIWRRASGSADTVPSEIRR